MHFDRFRLPLGSPLPSAVTIGTNQLLLLGVDRHHRLPLPLKGLDPPADVAELRVPVRMLSPFQGLAIPLQAVAHLMQQSIHRALADPVPFASQSFSESRRAAARPAQRPRRVAPRDRIELTLQRRRQSWIAFGQPLAPTPWTTQASPRRFNRKRLASLQFLQPGSHRDARHPRRLRHLPDPTPSDGARFRRRPEAARPFVQPRTHHRELVPYRLRHVFHDVKHTRWCLKRLVYFGESP